MDIVSFALLISLMSMEFVKKERLLDVLDMSIIDMIVLSARNTNRYVFSALLRNTWKLILVLMESFKIVKFKKLPRFARNAKVTSL